MGNLAAALTQLRREHEEAQQHVAQLGQAIQVIEKLVSRNADSTKKITTAPARTAMSDATRRKLSIAQKARWAAKSPVQSISPTPTKRTMSAAARKKISLALRARWAKVKSTAKKVA